MDKFVINGGKFLSGKVTIGGAKNASLALMPATILASGISRLSNTPDLRDVTTMRRLLETMGIEISSAEQTMTINTASINSFEAPYEHVKKMRASIYVLGPLVARFGKAKVSLPGGCAWGPRPVNLHVEGIRRLGAEIELEAGYIIAKAKRLHGARVLFDISSVGATGNVMMAAVLAKGTTLIENAAQEPEIVQLSEFLITMGAKIHGVGTGRLEIEGVDELHSADITTIPDRIEAGTFLIAGAIAGKRGGSIRLEKCNPHHIGALIIKLEDAGATVKTGTDWVELSPMEKIAPINATTAIYPGFPTDMQAQWIALMSLAGGTSIVTDTVYFDRFMHVPELVRLGANITVKENIATVVGVRSLAGAKVMSTDLRASASLVLAGLVAEGTTEVLRVYHIDRGYESMEKKLQALGADIRREQGEEF
ncbi:MAG: UDP-N-acetylglucosamine 1-carboxyvinyltransferase [Ignavibacteriae bacterium]|nr:MAG: UDP-N-acetylglucosamine 1-carboxyvinyltransferase [Ignavibacteriota bacterium]